MAEEAFERAVVALVETARGLDVGTVRSIQVDLQASLEVPYRIVTEEDTYPVAGVATRQAVPED